MRHLIVIIAVAATALSVAAPGASAAVRGTGQGTGKVAQSDLSAQPGGGTVAAYELKNVIISS